jgi:ABC-type transporter Mla subunit MlaD
MKDLTRRLKAVQRQLERLGSQARSARGEARTRMKRLERRTRVAVTKALRRTEPQVREALAEASRLGRGLRAGVRAGAAAYRAGARRK